MRIILLAVVLLLAGCIGGEGEVPQTPAKAASMTVDEAMATTVTALMPAISTTTTVSATTTIPFVPTTVTMPPWAIRQHPRVLACHRMGFNSANRRQCYALAAIYLGEPDICLKIPEGDMRNNCLIFSGNSSDICEGKSGDNKTACYILYGQAKEDESICDAAGRNVLRDECIYKVAYAKGDIALCANIDDEAFADICLARLGVASNDSGSCERIKDEYLKNDCYLEIGKNLDDPELCAMAQGQMRNPAIKDMCFADAAWGLGDVSVCKRISNEQYRESCIGAVIGDIKRCDKNPFYYGRSSCYIQVAKGASDPSVCMGLEDERKWWCIQAYAWSRKNISVCEMIKGGDDSIATEDTCRFGLAVESYDPSECKKLSDGKARNECLWGVGAVLGTQSVCEDIDSTGIRLDCKTVSFIYS